MSADEMRSSVSFQTGLTIKGKIALAGVILAGLGTTALVMLAVNGSLSLGGKKDPDENPFNKSGIPQEALPSTGTQSGGIEDAFREGGGTLPGDEPDIGKPIVPPVNPEKPVDPPAGSGFFKDNPFEE